MPPKLAKAASSLGEQNARRFLSLHTYAIMRNAEQKAEVR